MRKKNELHEIIRNNILENVYSSVPPIYIIFGSLHLNGRAQRRNTKLKMEHIFVGIYKFNISLAGYILQNILNICKLLYIFTESFLTQFIIIFFFLVLF